METNDAERICRRFCPATELASCPARTERHQGNLRPEDNMDRTQNRRKHPADRTLRRTIKSERTTPDRIPMDTVANHCARNFTRRFRKQALLDNNRLEQHQRKHGLKTWSGGKFRIYKLYPDVLAEIHKHDFKIRLGIIIHKMPNPRLVFLSLHRPVNAKICSMVDDAHAITSNSRNRRNANVSV